MADQNLKIDVLLADVGTGGEVLTDFVTQTQHNIDLSNKADLVGGKVKPEQLPSFSELSGVSTEFSGLETKLRGETDLALLEAKEYADGIVQGALNVKADLVGGRVPFEQATEFKNIPGAKGAIDGLKQSFQTSIASLKEEVQVGYAGLNEGRVSKTQLPLDTVFDYDLEEVKQETIEMRNINDAVIDIIQTDLTSDITMPDGSVQPSLRKLVFERLATVASDTGDVTADSIAEALVSNSNLMQASNLKMPDGKTQQDINDFGGAEWRSKVEGYKLGATVKLTNGVIVKSTVPNNIVNPNMDMTGWVKTNDTSQIFDASGLNQQQINELTLTPFQYGAIGDGISHKLSEKFSTLAQAQVIYPHATSLDDELDWAAIQSLSRVFFNNPIGSIHGKVMDISGDWCINKPIDLSQPTNQDGTYKTVRANMRINIDPMPERIYDQVILVSGRGVELQGVINLDVKRKCKYGIKVSVGKITGGGTIVNFGIRLPRLFLRNALVNNVLFNDSAMFSSVEFYRGQGAGIGGGVSPQVKATVSSNIASGVNTLDSLSVLTLDTLLDPFYEPETVLVSYNGFVSKVSSWDRVNNKITVRPHIPENLDTAVKLDFIVGAGIATRGSDTAGVLIAQMSSLDAIGLHHNAMYPCVVPYICTEYTGISIYNQGLVGGPIVTEHYYEGDTWQYIQDTDGYDIAGCANILASTNINFSKYQNIRWGRDSAGNTLASYGGLRGSRIYDKGNVHYIEDHKYPLNLVANSVQDTVVDFKTPYKVKTIKSNSTTLGIAPIDGNFNRLFGYDTQEVMVFGDGENGAPTGAIAIKPPSGYTINGSSSNLLFSGFDKPALFKFYLKVVAKDIIVSCASLSKVAWSNSAVIPAAITDATNLPVDTKYWFTGATAVTNLPTPTTGTQLNGSILTYYSHGRAGLPHNKTQVVEYPTIFEKWERVFSSSSGAYGAWTLTLYDIKKGTTAQRPASPKIGMRYYDTTLIAAGKPIEWNGSAWVDGAGVAV